MLEKREKGDKRIRERKENKAEREVDERKKNNDITIKTIRGKQRLKQEAD